MQNLKYHLPTGIGTDIMSQTEVTSVLGVYKERLKCDVQLTVHRDKFLQ